MGARRCGSEDQGGVVERNVRTPGNHPVSDAPALERAAVVNVQAPRLVFQPHEHEALGRARPLPFPDMRTEVHRGALESLLLEKGLLAPDAWGIVDGGGIVGYEDTVAGVRPAKLRPGQSVVWIQLNCSIKMLNGVPETLTGV